MWVLNTVHVLGKKKLGRPLGFGAVPIQLNLHVHMYYVDLHVCAFIFVIYDIIDWLMWVFCEISRYKCGFRIFQIALYEQWAIWLVREDSAHRDPEDQSQRGQLKFRKTCSRSNILNVSPLFLLFRLIYYKVLQI